MAAALGRLMGSDDAHDARAQPVAPPVSSFDLRAEMDELRDQLEHAFADLFDRMDTVEASATAARLQAAELRAGVAEVTGALATQQESLAALGGGNKQIVEGLEVLHDRLVQLGRREPVPVDLAPIEVRISQLAEGIGKHLAGDRARLEASFSGLAQEVARVGRGPIPLDTAALEEAASRGALHNAADIANLRREVAALSEVVASQHQGITELRATLDWIKDRLLLR